MAIPFRPRRSKKSTAINSNITLKKGELFFETPDSGIGTGLGRMKMGDGKTVYKDLPYFDSPSNVTKHDKPEKSSISEYSYSINYSSLNFQEGINWYNNNPMEEVSHGGCSSLREGNSFGRNYDWEFDNYVSTEINTNDPQFYKVTGLCGKIEGLDKDFMESGKDSDLFNILPYCIIDGTNEKGFGCNTNIVHSSEKAGETRPGVTTRLDSKMVISWLLHRCATVQEALTELKNINIYPNKYLNKNYGYEIHLMLNDINDCYVVEFENSNMYFINMNTGKYKTVIRGVESEEEIEIPNLAGKRCMTNFRIKNIVINDDGSLDKDAIAAVEPFAIGLERWSVLLEENDISLMEKMKLAQQKYAYSSETYPFWISEFSGSNNGITIYCNSDPDDPNIAPIIEYIIDYYNTIVVEEHNRFSETKPWQTVYTEVYNLEDKSVDICVQSEEESYKTVIHHVIGNTELGSPIIDAITSIIGNKWNSTVTYSIGDYVIYNMQLFKCTESCTNISPENESYWELTNLINEILNN